MSDISRVVLISGATGGVGKGIANYMAKCGYSVGVGFTHHPEKAKAIVHCDVENKVHTMKKVICHLQEVGRNRT